MAVLVCYASKHGATQGIAERVAETLRQLGTEVAVLPVDAVGDIGSHQAVVIGSAVYYGRWLKEATQFVRNNGAALAERPVWLFSSGPLGSQSHVDPEEIAEFRETIAPRDHRLFAGALARSGLSFAERLMVKGVGAPTGDYRDGGEIAAWAKTIAGELGQTGAA